LLPAGDSESPPPTCGTNAAAARAGGNIGQAACNRTGPGANVRVSSIATHTGPLPACNLLRTPNFLATRRVCGCAPQLCGAWWCAVPLCWLQRQLPPSGTNQVAADR